MTMRKIQRHDQIVTLTRQHKTVSVDELADKMDVSTQTIRRDINHLCQLNVLRRRHGWAELFEQQLNTPYDQRTTTNAAAKRAVSQVAADLIPDGATVFISIGTTPMMVAEALRDRKQLTIITNNLNAAMALSHETTNRIILPGGELRLPDRDILGEEVAKLFDGYRAEYGIFGVAGVASDGGLLDFHASEVAIREKIRAGCKTSILVLDSTKFGRAAPAVGGNIADVDVIVLDKLPNGEFAAPLEKLSERLKLVGEVTR